MPEAENLLDIEVAHAGAIEQIVIALRVAAGTTLGEAIGLAGIQERVPGLDAAPVGVFGQLRNRLDRVEQGDRVEIYRPLTADPKDVRRARSRKRRK